MSTLVHIFSVTLPFFALVLCGYVAARSRLLPLDAVPGLNMFVLYFALPCMLYRLGSSMPLAQLLDPVVGLIWLLATLVIVALAVWLARGRGAAWPDAAMGALVAAFPNSGFMGVPLILVLLGEQGVGVVMSTLMIDLVVTTSLCIGLSQLTAAGEHGAFRAAAGALRGVLRNPLSWSILLGALASATSLVLWGPVAQTIMLLGNAASPVALFAIGAALARSQMLIKRAEHGPNVAVRDIPWVVGIKLILHPLLILGGGLLAQRAGMMSPAMLAPLILTAALPSASNVSLLAERYGADNGRIARIILWSTIAAFITFSITAAQFVGK